MTSSIENTAVSCLLASTFHAESLQNAIQGCREKLGGAPDLVLVSVSPDYRSHLRAVIENFQIDGHASLVIGGSSVGIFGVGHELENASGISFLFFRLPGCRLRLLRGPEMEAAVPLVGADPAGLLVLSHPLRSGVQGPLPQLNHWFPGVPVIGGMITGGPEDEDLFLFSTAGIEETDSIAVMISGGVRIETFVAQGCHPIGEPMVVTSSRANVVESIAGREPFRVLEETFDSLGESLWEVAAGNIFAGLALREEVEEFSTGDFLIRSIVGADLTGGKLTLTTPPRVGQTIQFQLRNAATASQVLRETIRAIPTESGKPFAAFLVSGSGRGRRLFGEAHHDAAILEEQFGQVPMTGFFGNGEFGPVAGVNFRHDHSLCGALFFSS